MSSRARTIVDAGRSDKYAMEAARFIDELFLIGYSKQEILNVHLVGRLMLEHLTETKIDGEIVGVEALVERCGLVQIWKT